MAWWLKKNCNMQPPPVCCGSGDWPLVTHPPPSSLHPPPLPLSICLHCLRNKIYQAVGMKTKTSTETMTVFSLFSFSSVHFVVLSPAGHHDMQTSLTNCLSNLSLNSAVRPNKRIRIVWIALWLHFLITHRLLVFIIFFRPFSTHPFSMFPIRMTELL